MPNGSDRVTSHPLQELQPAKSIDNDPEIKAWLALGIKTKKKGGGKKKKGGSKRNLIKYSGYNTVDTGLAVDQTPLILLSINNSQFELMHLQAKRVTKWRIQQKPSQWMPRMGLQLKNKSF
jgi:hypothetical protein